MFIYYVYAYLRKSDNTPYYIGKGKGSRAFKKHSNISIPKDHTKIVFLEQNLSEVGAFALERRYIEWYGRKNLGNGILLNKTEGGEGLSGYKLTSSHKNKIGIKNKGKQPTKEAIVKAALARTKLLTGKPRPDWVKEKLKKPKPIIECPHCKKTGGVSAMHRWHFNNCRALH